MEFLPNYIEGLWFKSINNSIIRFQRGIIAVCGEYFILDKYKDITIDNITILDGSLEEDTVYYVYVSANVNSNVLSADNFLLSKQSPDKDCFGKSVNYLEFFDGRTSLYLDDYRCIGALYYYDHNKKLSQFDKAYLGYWESNWRDLNELPLHRNRYTDVYHGLGIQPRSWKFLFKPDLSCEFASFQEFYKKGHGFWEATSFGVQIGKHMSHKHVNFYCGNQIFHFSDKYKHHHKYDGWFYEGYGKMIVTAW